MKRLFLILFLTLSLNAIAEKHKCLKSNSANSILLQGIPDGWYQAAVEYSNFNTGTRATYTLKVKVSYGRVTVIDFGNGGSVHSGYNNEGYIYSGGSLDYVTDYNTGQITSATATVRVSDNNGSRTFKILIS